jgi:hypothetical protein
MKYTYFLLQLNKYTNFSEYPKESDRKATKKTAPKSGFFICETVFWKRKPSSSRTGLPYFVSLILLNFSKSLSYAPIISARKAA